MASTASPLRRVLEIVWAQDAFLEVIAGARTGAVGYDPGLRAKTVSVQEPEAPC